MLDILGSTNRTCDGVSRRNFLRVGSLAVGGMTLPQLLRSEAVAKEAGSSAKRKAVILVWQAGGPSHLDMYDLKPTAPAEYRGEFKPIPTNVSGIEIGEHLPLQAAMFDKFSVVRSAYHTNAGHGMGSQWMLTGYQPTIEVNDNIYPSCGSVVAALRGPNEAGMPAYCNVPNRLDLGKAAYLGASFNPFSPDSNPNDASFQVRNMKLPGNLSLNRLERRQQLLGQVDTIRRDIDAKGGHRRSRQVLSRCIRDGHQRAGTASVRHPHGRPKAARKVRPQRSRPKLSARATAGGVGCDLRHRSGGRRLGHARQ